MTFVLSAEDLADAEFESVKNLKHLVENFGGGTSSLLLVEPPENRAEFSFQELCVLQTWYRNERARNPNIQSSISIFDLRKSDVTQNKLSYPLLLNLDCLGREQLPTQFYSQVDRSPWKNLLVGGEKRDLTFQFTFQEADDYTFGKFDPKFVTELRESFANEVTTQIPHLKAHWVGSADYQYYSKLGIKRSYILNFLLIFLLIGAFRFFFGTWRIGLMMVLTLITSGVLLYGAKAFFNSPFDNLSNSLFLILGVSTVEDFVFVAYQQLKFGTSPRRSLLMMVVPCFFTSLTTMLGFLSLLSSDLGIIRSLGLWSAAGTLLEWGIVFLVLPTALRIFKSDRSWVNPDRAFLFSQLSKLGSWSPPRLLSKLSLIVILLATALSSNLNFSNVPEELFSADHPFRQGLETLKNSRGWKVGVQLVFGDQQTQHQNEEILQKIQTDPLVKSIESPYSIENYLLEGKDKATQDIIRNELLAAPFLDQYISNEGVVRTNLYLKEDSLHDLNGLHQRVKSLCPEEQCWLTGALVTYADFAERVPKTLFDSLMTSVLLVALVLIWIALAVRQTRNIPWLLLSSLWGPALMFLFLAVSQMQIDFLTCVFASVLVGLTGDNAIQYLLAHKKNRAYGGSASSLENGIEQRAGGSIACALIMASTTLVFLGSYFGPPRVFGLLLGGGLIAAMIGDLWVLSGLIKKNGE